jgi:hypothetical protein
VKVTLAGDAGPDRADDGDLVLLDDEGIGHAAGRENGSIRRTTAR